MSGKETRSWQVAGSGPGRGEHERMATAATGSEFADRESGPEVVRVKLTVSNVYLVRGEAGSVLVDSGDPGNGEKISNKLAKIGIAKDEISLILLTHGHVDHFGSAAELKRLTGAPVAIHEADAGHLMRGRNPSLPSVGLEGRVVKPFLKHEAPPVSPDVTFRGEMDLAEYGVSAKVIETPGHTSGSVSVVTSSGEVVVGDVLAGGYLGFMFRPWAPRYHLFAEDLGAVRESIRGILDLSPATIFPGHGGPLEPEAVRRWFYDGALGSGDQVSEPPIHFGIDGGR